MLASEYKFIIRLAGERLVLRMAVSTILFEDIFDVKDIDHGGKKFERGLCS